MCPGGTKRFLVYVIREDERYFFTSACDKCIEDFISDGLKIAPKVRVVNVDHMTEYQNLSDWKASQVAS